MEMWDALCSYFASYSDVDKAGKVRNIHRLLSNYKSVVSANVLTFFNKFNVYFQTSRTSTIYELQYRSDARYKARVIHTRLHKEANALAL